MANAPERCLGWGNGENMIVALAQFMSDSRSSCRPRLVRKELNSGWLIDHVEHESCHSLYRAVNMYVL
jgi:hypothetical protein